MIKGLRRSLKGDKRSSSGSSKSQSNASSGRHGGQSQAQALAAVTPPKKIIKAIYDYHAQRPGELSFSKGDFLYVVGNEDSETWYDACDPPSQLQGVVPVTYFEVVSRQEVIPTVPISELMNSINRDGTVKSNGTRSVSSSSTSSKPKPTMAIYGVVLYDFTAERPDELQAKTGDAIIIIAQSNEEWFVAKPIGKLGGPGLIPVSYVELKEVGSDKPVDNPQEAIKKAGVPKVEEWKRLAAEYKASSISLGKFEDDTASISRQMQAMAIREQHIQHQQQLQRHSQATGGAGGGAIHSFYDQNGNRTSVSTTSRVTSTGAVSAQSGSVSVLGGAAAAASSASSSSSAAYVVRASVDRYAFHAGRYWYLLMAEMSNGRHRNLCRYYQDFYDFQIKLLDEFPEEAGRTGKERLLPYMPGPLTYVNDSISSQRRVNLDEYVHKLVALPEYISRSAFVLQLFDIRPGDVEAADVSSTMPEPIVEGGHVQGVEGQLNESENVQTPLQVPPQGSGSPQTPLQAPSQILSEPSHSRVDSQNTLTEVKQQTQQVASGSEQQRGLQDHENNNNDNDNDNNNNNDLDNPAVQEKAQVHALGYSNGSSGIAAKTAPSFVKIKVFYNDDLIAIRFPSDASFESLKGKICERLQLDNVKLMHKNDLTGTAGEIDSEEEFSHAVNGKSKLVFHAASI